MVGPDDKTVSLETVVPPTVVPEAPPIPAQPEPVAAVAPASAVVPPAADAGAPPADASAEPSPTHEPTLLDKHDAKKAPPVEAKQEDKPAEPVKAEEAKPEAEAKPADAVESVAPAPAPIDYFAAETGIKIPETLKVDDTTRGELVTAFDAFRTDPVKGGQALLDMHNRVVADMAKQLQDDQWRVFRETNAEWNKQVMADPILGGAGHDTAMERVAIARDNFASAAKPGSAQYTKELAEFNDALRITGAGNHPAILRAFYNAAKYVREAAPPPTDGKPPKDIGKNPSGRKGALVYDNPTSNPSA